MREEIYNVKVYKTYDYDKFEFADSNRAVVSTKLLENNISQNDYTFYKPILVSKDMRIIDGQHRFTACKNLGLPIYYRIYDGSSDFNNIMITLNRYQKNWTYEDFVDYYAKEGDASYIDFISFLDMYDFSFSQGLLVYTKKEKVQIKNGEKLIKRENADDIARFLIQANVREFKMTTTIPFTRAIIEVFKTYSPKQIKRLAKYMGAIKKCATIEQYLGYFEKYKGAR